MQRGVRFFLILVVFLAGYGFEVTGPEFDEDGVMQVPMRRPAQA